MASADTVARVREIDAFLAGSKELHGPQPKWVDDDRPNQMRATWSIREENDVFNAKLIFRMSRLSTNEPSISVIYKNSKIYRIDIKDESDLDENPIFARRFGLPGQIYGTHHHPWRYNRDYILETGAWEIPIKEKISQSTKRIPQALSFLSEEIRLDLTQEQRQFEGPSRRDLFDGALT